MPPLPAARPPVDRVALLALLLLAAAARLPGLAASLGHDELFTLARFATSPRAALTTQVVANNHPPASLLAWAASHAAGWAPAPPEVVVRAPFALLGALLAPALVLAGRGAVGARGAWLAGGLAALAPLAVDLSRQVRGYAPALLAAGALAGLVPAALAGRSARAGPLAAAAALGVWAHPTLLLGVAAWLALAAARPAGPGRRATLVGLGGGALAGLLLLAPTLGRTAKAARGLLAPAAGEPTPRLGLADLLDVLGGGAPDPSLGDGATGPLSLALAALLLALAARGARALARAGRGGEAAALAAPLAAALLLPLAGAPAYPRFAAFALPAALLLAGRGLAAARAPLPALALALALAAPVVAAGAATPLQDLRGAARLARDAAGPRGVVLGAGPGGELVPTLDPAAAGDPDFEATRAALAGPGPVVVVVPLPPWTPADVRAALAARGGPAVLPGRAGAVEVWLVPPRAP